MANDRSKSKKKGGGAPATLSELIAAKNYPEAIEVLRAQLAQRPGIQTRLQLADLLLLAGRRGDAMPIFIGLADELAKDGFIAKALAILKRVDRLEPGRADVDARLKELAKSPAARSALLPSPPPPAPPPPPPAPVFGIEEIRDDAPGVAPAAAIEAPPAAEPSVPPAEPPEAGPTIESAPSDAPKVDEAAAAPPLSASGDAPAPAVEAPAPERKREAAKLGGIWKRLMTALAPIAEAPPKPAAAESAPPPDVVPSSDKPAEEMVTADAPADAPPVEGSGAASEPPSTAKPATATEPDMEESFEPPAVASAAPAESPVADAPVAGVPPEAAAPTAEPAPVVAEPEPGPPETEAAHKQEETTATDAESEPAVVVEPEPIEEETAPVAASASTSEAASEVEVEVEVEVTPETRDDPAPESPAVVAKLGGVFKKFLANLPGGEPPAVEPAVVEAAAAEVAPAPEETDATRAAEAQRAQEDLDFAAVLSAAGIDPATANEDEEAFFDAFVDEDDAPAEVIGLPAPAEASEAGAEVSTSTLPPLRSGATAPRWTSPVSETGFRDQVLDLIEEVLKRPAEVTPAAPGETTEPIANAYKDELVVHPLFRDLSENEMLAMLRALRLACFDPGEIIVSEGEPGAGLFLLVAGTVKVFARNPSGHNLPIGTLTEGSFFGEMSLLSGRPRNATVVATDNVELLELPKPLLDAIAISHPRVRDIVDALYLQRASSPEMAAVRNVPIGEAHTRERATQVLKGYFGGRRWEPRMQLKLAMVLLKAGKEDEAVPVLVDLAETLLREGNATKAIAILKKVEAIRKRGLQVVNLAPLKFDEDDIDGIGPPVATPTPKMPAWGGRTQAFFSDWLMTARRRAQDAEAAPKKVPGYGPELVASPLFAGFSEEELLAFIQGLRLSVYDPGDIILTEGEPGQSVFILTQGTVRVFVRNPAGHDLQLCQLREGAFFGEMSALSGRPRTATVTAASRCEVLEMDRTTLDAIAQKHPRIRQVLEEVYIERASSSQAERIRTTSAPPT